MPEPVIAVLFFGGLWLGCWLVALLVWLWIRWRTLRDWQAERAERERAQGAPDA